MCRGAGPSPWGRPFLCGLCASAGLGVAVFGVAGI
jgi:hypothetical protein